MGEVSGIESIDDALSLARRMTSVDIATMAAGISADV